MQSIPLELIDGRLTQIIGKLSPGEEIVLTRDGKPVATVRVVPQALRESPRLGTLKGTILYLAPDFDDIPEGFAHVVEWRRCVHLWLCPRSEKP